MAPGFRGTDRFVLLVYYFIIEMTIIEIWRGVGFVRQLKVSVNLLFVGYAFTP